MFNIGINHYKWKHNMNTMFNIVILIPCFQIEKKSTFYNKKIIVDTRYSCLPSIKRHLLCFCSINSTKKNSNLFIAQSETSQILY